MPLVECVWLPHTIDERAGIGCGILELKRLRWGIWVQKVSECLLIQLAHTVNERFKGQCRVSGTIRQDPNCMTTVPQPFPLTLFATLFLEYPDRPLLPCSQRPFVPVVATRHPFPSPKTEVPQQSSPLYQHSSRKGSELSRHLSLHYTFYSPTGLISGSQERAHGRG